MNTAGIKHLAIIMDGNRRWASSQGMPAVFGHRAGARNVESVVKVCRKHGINYLTLYAFSQENWQRSAEEVTALMGILRHYLQQPLSRLIQSGTRVSFMGDRSRLPADILQLMAKVEQSSINNQFHLLIALAYSGREEIIAAAAELLRTEEIDAPNLPKFLQSARLGIPDPDLLIRTGGEHRLSNFMLWQVAYTELCFIDKYWPDFNEQDLDNAVEQFKQRTRRYGK